MLIQEIVKIPLGPRGRARIQVPRILYHSLRGRQLAANGDIQAYPLSRQEQELELLYPEEMRHSGYVWLSPTPLSREALRIPAEKLDPKRLRWTGQSEGYLLYSGDIPSEAIL